MDASTYIAKLVEQSIDQTEKQAAQAGTMAGRRAQQYTPGICQQTLQTNEEFPIHDE